MSYLLTANQTHDMRSNTAQIEQPYTMILSRLLDNSSALQ